MTRSVKPLLAAANAVVNSITVHDAIAYYGDEEVTFVDIRDTAEREKHGTIPGAVHIPRGNLEFAVDPDVSMHDPVFDSGDSLILYCASGGRSALATKTLLDMGIVNVAHIAGGFAAWREAGGPVQAVDQCV